MLLAASTLHAKSDRWFPRKPGECGWVHGRFAIYNGSGVRRIWVTGTDHLLNLTDDDDAPPELNVGFEKWLYGDFYVCAIDPFERDHMQQVHVRRVRNLVSTPSGYGH